MMQFLNKTSTKITLGIVLITTIILAYISIFAVSTAQNEFQSAAIQFQNGQTFIVKPEPFGPIEVIRQKFNQNLINTILLAGILGFLMAITAGIIFSIIITQPLRQLVIGINNLKTSKYKSKLEPTGESEFDEVIEEFNDLAKELEYQEDLRKDLISDVSHELKTPLTSMLGQIQGMRDGVFEIDSKRLELIQHDAERLNQLIEMLQEYTKLRSTIPNLQKEELKLFKIAEYIKDSYAPILNEKKIQIKNEIPEDYTIQADRTILERIFNNIIDNAIKYSGGTEIVLGVGKDSFFISDNGTGIEEQYLKKIFERFYRIEKSRSRKTGGLGLGLALVHEMVEAHGWEIEAKNNAEGKGVHFIIHTK